MAHLNLLSICVLAAFASGECFFSRLMNEPLNFAVSLLDRQSQDMSGTTESWVSEPNSYEATVLPVQDDSVQMSSSRPNNMMMAKNMIRNSMKSTPKAKVKPLRGSSMDSSSSQDMMPVNRWLKSRGQKSMMAKPMSSLMLSGYSKNRQVLKSVKASPLMNRGGPTKLSWFGSGMSRSDNKLPVVKPIYKKNKIAMASSPSRDSSVDFLRMDSDSSSSEENFWTPSSMQMIPGNMRAFPRSWRMRSNVMSSNRNSWNKMNSFRARKPSRYNA